MTEDAMTLIGFIGVLRKTQERAEGTAPPERVKPLRKILLIAVLVAFALLIIFLLTISLAASFNPGGFRRLHGKN